MADFFKDHIFVGHAVAACGSIALTSSLSHPIDTLKTLLQLGAGASQQLRFSQVLDRVRSVSGRSCTLWHDINHASILSNELFLKYRSSEITSLAVEGLYNGFCWSVLGSVSGLSAHFGIYEILTAFYKDGREDNYVYVSEALLAGIAAGGVEAVVCTPFEFFKLRKQVTSASRSGTITSIKVMQENTPLILKLLPSYIPDVRTWNNTVSILSKMSPSHIDMVGALKQYPWMLTGSGRPPLASEVKQPRDIISLESWSSLWRGLRSGIARDCVFGGIFFSTWQFFHIAMLNWKAIDMNPEPRSIDDVGPVSPLATSLAAGFSGTVAAAASHTFDTAKSRSQCIVIPKYIAMERKLLKWQAPGIWIERVTGMSPADRHIMFRGIWLRMARSGIASFAIVGSYLLAVDHLS